MSDATLVGIGELVTNDPSIGEGKLGLIRDAALVVEDGMVTWVGSSSNLPEGIPEPVDVEGAAVLPGFVDSHSHLVFAGDRYPDFEARFAGPTGVPYAARGIRSTVRATRSASRRELRDGAARLMLESIRTGTTTMEIKSGYGLTAGDELRSLQVAAEFTDELTFMGGHVVPEEYADDPTAYVDLVCGEMLEACAPAARWIDVFCESGAFDEDQSRRILLAGKSAGLMPRIHANQLGHGPGVQLAVEVGAASADHLTYLTDDDIEALAGSEVVATLLPTVEFSTRSPYPDARRLLDAGATVALSPDCNPGSSFTTSMPLCIALAVREMGMTVHEAIWAATAGGAQALRRHDIGRLSRGCRADLQILAAPHVGHLAYRPGAPLTAEVWISGEGPS